MADAIQDALSKANKKLHELMADRKKIDKQILDWKRVIDSLTVVSEEVSDHLPSDVEMTLAAYPFGPFEEPGADPKKYVYQSMRLKFTDAVREILRLQSPKVLRVPAIRDYLVQWEFDFSKYKQELVPIHNTLSRLEEQRQAESVHDKRGRLIGYRWTGPLDPKDDLKELAKAVMFAKSREATPKVASQKGQVKTDDTASTNN